MNEPTQIAFPIPEAPKPPASPAPMPVANPASVGTTAPAATNLAQPAQPASTTPAVTAPVVEFKPYSVNAANETVESRITGLLDTDSINMQRAKSRGQLDAARRGLLNSSIAGQAGQAALIDQALPIASSDAAWYRQVASDNFRTGNEIALANAGHSLSAATTSAQIDSAKTLQQMQADTTLTVADKQAATQKFINNQNIETQKFLAKEESALKTAMQNVDVASRGALQASANASAKDLANIQADYQTLIRADASAAQAVSDAAKARLEIMMDKTMSPEGRVKSLNLINNQLKATLNLHGSINGVDLTSLLDTFGGDATVVQTNQGQQARPAAGTPRLTRADVEGFMSANNIPMDANGLMAAVNKWNTDNPGNNFTIEDVGAAYGLNPQQTWDWVKKNPGK